jgi:hypothetical protein
MEGDEDSEVANNEQQQLYTMMSQTNIQPFTINVKIPAGFKLRNWHWMCHDNNFRQDLREKELLSTSNSKLKSYAGDTIISIDQIMVEVTFKNLTHELCIQVIKIGEPLLVGRGFLDKFSIRFENINNIRPVGNIIGAITDRYAALFYDPPGKYVWERVRVDCLVPMNGNYNFVLIDAYSKWPEVFKMEDIRTETTVNKLRGTFVRSDNGPQFTAQEYGTHVELHQIKHVKTPVYHPQSNGEAENFVKMFKQVLK